MSNQNQVKRKERQCLNPRSPILYFREKEKREMVEDFLNSGNTMISVWTKYTGRTKGEFQIKRWMIKYGYEDKRTAKSTIFETNPNSMAKNDVFSEEDSFETLQLKKRIADLEKQVSDSEMKAAAFSTMVDLAEKEFNISIRKKYNTKPSKK
ncbi:MAG: hypothetical protein A2W98_08550 [Bacteroidetes bacterium GWF2_33_38]|nr:MAG: hypothetical protein A2W98_08550 [Bacteroidetes bacterium GWF2_33_38]OFY72809.1 MAG: hypothetical protein A2265_08610 [Bacteroidetes bacterium RIFOXYA12_FULL_33_9]